MAQANLRDLDLAAHHKRVFGKYDRILSDKIRKIQDSQTDMYFKIGDNKYALFEFMPELKSLMITNRSPLVLRIIENGKTELVSVFRDSLSANSSAAIANRLDGYKLDVPVNRIPEGVNPAADVMTVADFMILPGPTPTSAF